MEIIAIAKVSSKGKITIPITIRKMLGLKAGSKVIFIQKDNGVMMFKAKGKVNYEK